MCPGYMCTAAHRLKWLDMRLCIRLDLMSTAHVLGSLRTHVLRSTGVNLYGQGRRQPVWDAPHAMRVNYPTASVEQYRTCFRCSQT